MHEFQREIRRQAAMREITRLYHFTPARNARSILCNGLASRNVLASHDIEFFASDTMRLDEMLDAVSVSIHSINSRMFAAKKREYRDDWLILELDASILWTHSCRFCRTNAAASEIRKHRGFLGGPWAFAKMFEDRPVSQTDDTSIRSKLQRAPFHPTDESAEVQVLDPIGPELIIDVTVRNQRVKGELESVMKEVGQIRPIEIYEEAFN